MALVNRPLAVGSVLAPLAHYAGRQYGPAIAKYAAGKASDAASYLLRKVKDRAAISRSDRPYPPPRRAQWSGRRNRLKARSGGFIKTRKKVSHKTKRARISARGVYENIERGIVYSSLHCLYVGHASAPVERLKQVLMYAFVKALAMKIGTVPVDFDDNIAFGVSGDIWRIGIRNSNETAGGTSNIDFTHTADGVTYRAIASKWLAGFSTGVPAQTQIVFTSMEFIPVLATSLQGAKVIVLAGAKVQFDCKASLKIQNRTVQAAGDDEADVNNVPVYGKSYYGRGNGTNYARYQGAAINPFVADYYGVLRKESTSTNPLMEPPEAFMFTDVKKKGKLRIEPGEIKTSNLTSSFTISLAHVPKMLFDAASSADVFRRSPLGDFRFFAIEKMIHVNGDTNNITIALEHNLMIGAQLKLGRTDYTTKVISMY